MPTAARKKRASAEPRFGACPCASPTKAADHPHAAHAGRWQVFGLMGEITEVITYWLSLPRTVGSSAQMTAVVPTYRCGAVPDFHQVPSCASPSGGWAGPAAPLYMGLGWSQTPRFGGRVEKPGTRGRMRSCSAFPVLTSP